MRVKVPVRGLCLQEPVEWVCVHHPLHEGGAIARRGGERCVYKSLLGQGVCATLLLREGCASVCTGGVGLGLELCPGGLSCSGGAFALEQSRMDCTCGAACPVAPTGMCVL